MPQVPYGQIILELSFDKLYTEIFQFSIIFFFLCRLRTMVFVECSNKERQKRENNGHAGGFRARPQQSMCVPLDPSPGRQMRGNQARGSPPPPQAIKASRTKSTPSPFSRVLHPRGAAHLDQPQWKPHFGL
jgi:hypothetical protein